ncbi:hypothetical protein QZH41_011835 [Actinostola sp. cb2023]|nr:hypothetical protein QZH41_011835 [Actinostola sp. cb2023]
MAEIGDEFLIGGRKLAQLKNDELKQELEKRGLKKSGNKAVLVERLSEYLFKELYENQKPEPVQQSAPQQPVQQAIPQQQVAFHDQAIAQQPSVQPQTLHQQTSFPGQQFPHLTPQQIPGQQQSVQYQQFGQQQVPFYHQSGDQSPSGLFDSSRQHQTALHSPQNQTHQQQILHQLPGQNPGIQQQMNQQQLQRQQNVLPDNFFPQVNHQSPPQQQRSPFAQAEFQQGHQEQFLQHLIPGQSFESQQLGTQQQQAFPVQQVERNVIQHQEPSAGPSVIQSSQEGDVKHIEDTTNQQVGSEPMADEAPDESSSSSSTIIDEPEQTPAAEEPQTVEKQEVAMNEQDDSSSSSSGSSSSQQPSPVERSEEPSPAAEQDKDDQSSSSSSSSAGDEEQSPVQPERSALNQEAPPPKEETTEALPSEETKEEETPAAEKMEESPNDGSGLEEGEVDASSNEDSKECKEEPSNEPQIVMEPTEEEKAVVDEPKPVEKKTRTPLITKKRKISIPSTGSTPVTPPTDGPKRRRWGSASKSSKPISTESLKVIIHLYIICLIRDLIPGVQVHSTPAFEAVMDFGNEDQDDGDEKETGEVVDNDDTDKENKDKDAIEQEAERPEPETKKRKERIVKLEEGRRKIKIKNHTAELDEVKGEVKMDVEEVRPTLPKTEPRLPTIPILTQSPVRAERSPSPARNTESVNIHVKNLVRPFTLNQLKELLGKSGTLVDDGFWIDKIKSHCYAVYSDIEGARATRAVLHGVKWPPTSPKILSVEYEDHQQMAHDTDGTLGKKSSDDDATVNKQEQDIEKPREAEEEKEKRMAEEDNSPADLLDNLFRKTKTTPCLYWLPLTTEQIVKRDKEREDKRKRREEERKREDEEIEKRREERDKEREKEREQEREREKEREQARSRARNNSRDRSRDNRGRMRSRSPVRRRQMSRSRSRSRSWNNRRK